MQPQKPLSAQQEKIYGKLLEGFGQDGHVPQLADLARELNLHYTTLRQHLQALAAKGYVRFESRGTGRAPIIALLGQALGLPVVGDIPAGPLNSAIEHAEGYLPLSTRGKSFGLKVRGDSMADLIQDGDVVLLVKDATPRPGDICALRIGESDVTLKYLEWSAQTPERRVLRAHNPDYPSQTLAADELTVEGVYRGLLRGDVIAELLKEP